MIVDFKVSSRSPFSYEYVSVMSFSSQDSLLSWDIFGIVSSFIQNQWLQYVPKELHSLFHHWKKTSSQQKTQISWILVTIRHHQFMSHISAPSRGRRRAWSLHPPSGQRQRCRRCAAGRTCRWGMGCSWDFNGISWTFFPGILIGISWDVEWDLMKFSEGYTIWYNMIYQIS